MADETTRRPAGTVTRVCLMLTALLALSAGPARAAVTPPERKLTPNAALVYWQAFALVPGFDDKAPSPLEDWKNAKIDDAARTLIKRGDRALRLLHKAVAIDACDWGIDWSDGPGTALPHLGKARRLAHLAMLRARVRHADGRTDGALADITAALHLARDVGRRGVLLELLVQLAIEREALAMLTARAPALTAKRANALAAQLDRLPPGTDLSQAILAEKTGTVDWLCKNGRKALFEAMGQNPDSVPDPLRGKTDAELTALLKDLGAQYEVVSTAAALPHAQAAAKLAELDKRFGASLNPFVPILLPTVTNIFKQQAAVFKQREALRATLRPPAR